MVVNFAIYCNFSHNEAYVENLNKIIIKIIYKIYIND
jgi:hypothetical protein